MYSHTFQPKLQKAWVFDLKKIVNFEKEVLNDNSEYSSEKTLKKLLQSEKSEILLIKDNRNNICGYGIIKINYYKTSISAHILKLAVSLNYRRQGFAKNILENFEKFALKKSASRIYAEVRESNVASLSLFYSFGFKRIKKLFGYYSCLDNSYELENGIKLCKDLCRL